MDLKVLAKMSNSNLMQVFINDWETDPEIHWKEPLIFKR